ncbi:hypothetical protein [Streptomyces sp. NPDC003710]
MFGLIDQISVRAALAAVPVFAWEVCLALVMPIKGFRAPVAARPVPAPSPTHPQPSTL